MFEIPTWAIWLMIVMGACVLGIGIGYLLQLSLTWRLRHDNEVMRLKLKEVGEFVDRYKKTPGTEAEGAGATFPVSGGYTA
uniref:Lipopolysaccharide assembly protein A domain-containing protein n=1 Tax=viral metagenome TaxID=1070528 RepID=A0A6H1ZF34_9ZZZZ